MLRLPKLISLHHPLAAQVFVKSLYAIVSKRSNRRITICSFVRLEEVLSLCLYFGLLYQVLVT